MSIHGMLAAVLQAPELAIDKDDSKQLAQSIANVARHYDLGVSAKAMDWGNLAIAVTSVYGPRLLLLRNRRIAERQAASAETHDPDDVIDLGNTEQFMGAPGNAH